MQKTISESLLPLAAGLLLGLLAQGIRPAPAVVAPEPSTTSTLELTEPVQLVLEVHGTFGSHGDTGPNRPRHRV